MIVSRVFNVAAAFLVSRRTLVVSLEAAENRARNACANAVRLRDERDVALRQACAYRADRDVARQLAADLARDSL